MKMSDSVNRRVYRREPTKKIACAATVTSICLSLSSVPQRIQHTSFLCLVKRYFVMTSTAFGTEFSPNQPQITTKTVNWGKLVFKDSRHHQGRGKCSHLLISCDRRIGAGHGKGAIVCLPHLWHLSTSWGCCDYLVKIATLSTRTKLTMANDPLTGTESASSAVFAHIEFDTIHPQPPPTQTHPKLLSPPCVHDLIHLFF